MSARDVDEILCCPKGCEAEYGNRCGLSEIGPEVRAALSAAGYAVVPVATLDVQPDADAPGVYVRFQRMEEAQAFARAMIAAAQGEKG